MIVRALSFVTAPPGHGGIETGGGDKRKELPREGDSDRVGRPAAGS